MLQVQNEHTDSSYPRRLPSYHSAASSPPTEVTRGYSLVERYENDTGGNPFVDHTNDASGGAHDDPSGGPIDAQLAKSSGWQYRQERGASRLRRYPTRKIHLIQGTVLSVDYPVPSAIRNAIEPKYMNESGSPPEEFTHLRCKSYRK